MSAVTRVKLAMYAVICALLAFGVAGSAEAPVNCSGVRETLTGLGFPAEEEMLPEEATGGDLRVCAPHRSCCSSRMQENFHRRSSRDLQKILELTSEELRDTFMSGHKRFDDFFVELLESSERALNDMFVRTYGKPYMQNAEVFQGLFAELRRYYAGGNVHLEEMLSDFWTRLLERMFRLLNSEYVVSEDYLECISKHAEQLKPFGDVPRKLRSQVTRAFVSARTFVQGLMVGREVASKASAVSVSSQCVGRYSRMMFCWWCEGGSPAPPCRSHCLRVMKSCLQHQDQLQTPWSSFIGPSLTHVLRFFIPPFTHLLLPSHSLSHSLCFSLSFRHSLSLSFSFTISHTLNPSIVYCSLSLFIIHYLPPLLSLFLSHSFSLPFPYIPNTLPPSLSLSLSYTLLSLTLSNCCIDLFLYLPLSLFPSLLYTSLSLIFSPSFSCSLTLTFFISRFLSLSHILPPYTPLSHSLSPSFFLSPLFSRSLPCSLCLSSSLSFSHTPSLPLLSFLLLYTFLSFSLPRSPSLSFTLSHTPSLIYTLSVSPLHSHTHIHTPAHTLVLFSVVCCHIASGSILIFCSFLFNLVICCCETGSVVRVEG